MFNVRGWKLREKCRNSSRFSTCSSCDRSLLPMALFKPSSPWTASLYLGSERIVEPESSTQKISSDMVYLRQVDLRGVPKKAILEQFLRISFAFPWFAKVPNAKSKARFSTRPPVLQRVRWVVKLGLSYLWAAKWIGRLPRSLSATRDASKSSA